MAKKRGGKAYVPAISNLSQSGLEKWQADQLVKKLLSEGVKERDIKIEDDDGDYTGYEGGPFFVVSYRQ